ncbi:MAG: hypothetical protein ACI93H_001546 [Psychromonas sp.]|jgi:hypothetical protein
MLFFWGVSFTLQLSFIDGLSSVVVRPARLTGILVERVKNIKKGAILAPFLFYNFIKYSGLNLHLQANHPRC